MYSSTEIKKSKLTNHQNRQQSVGKIEQTPLHFWSDISVVGDQTSSAFSGHSSSFRSATVNSKNRSVPRPRIQRKIAHSKNRYLTVDWNQLGHNHLVVPAHPDLLGGNCKEQRKPRALAGRRGKKWAAWPPSPPGSISPNPPRQPPKKASPLEREKRTEKGNSPPSSSLEDSVWPLGLGPRDLRPLRTLSAFLSARTILEAAAGPPPASPAPLLRCRRSRARHQLPLLVTPRVLAREQAPGRPGAALRARGTRG